MNVPQATRRILAAYYWAAYSLHHFFFLRPRRPLAKSRLVVIGSFRAGGAGKTPFTLWLAKQLIARQKRVAILCHKSAKDETAMLEQHLQAEIQRGNATVISTGNRSKSAENLDRSKNPPDFILCDDGFEDSRLRPQVIFRLDWEKPPTEIHQLIPAGKFRSLLQDHTPDESRTIALRCTGTTPDLFFQIESISNCNGQFPDSRQSIALCGLGDPSRFLLDLKRAEFIPHKQIIRPDHDRHFQEYISSTLRKHPTAQLVISEKDYYRLHQEQRRNPRIFVARQSIQVFDKARTRIFQALAL